MTQIIQYILYPILLLYLLWIIVFILTTLFQKQSRAVEHKSETRDISIIIPYRNEETHLETLIKSLASLTYDGKLEVLLIDDDSDDSSAKIITAYKHLLPFPIKQLSGTYDKNIPLSRKQQALDLGIREAQYDYIAFTDADMQLHPNWLSSLDCAMQPDIALVYGHSVIAPVNSLFSWLQAMQLEFLFAVAAVFEQTGITGSCMGNNLLLRKESYIKTGGFTSIGYTVTEDRALLRHLRKNGYGTALSIPFGPTATTPPHYSFKQYLNQQIRWAKGGFSSGKNLLLFGILFGIELLSIPVAVMGFTGEKLLYLSSGNFFLTWLFAAAAFHRNRSIVSPLLFPFLYPFLLCETLIYPFLLLFAKNHRWKGMPV